MSWNASSLGKPLSFGAALAAMLMILSCNAGLSSTIPTPARATIPTASASGSNAATENGGLTRTNQGGSVTVEVTWEKAAAGDPLRFKVVMDTHSVDLDGVDLSKSAVLRNDAGKEVSPERWDAPPGGHHRSGTLAFPAAAGGSPLVGPQAKFIELVLRDVAGVKERSFKWDVSS